jgi:hypothetical protein
MEALQELDLLRSMRWLFSDIAAFARISSLVLRPYQLQVARRIIDSVLNNRGDSIVVIFPRQSGKNELQAQIETFLLVTFQIDGAEMVKISPTWKPQSLNAMRRLERILRRNRLTYHYWQKESGYIYRIFEARIAFLSGAPETNIVGATANRLLEVDEAQDVQIDKYDKEIAPMAASTNATRVFWGTAWTSKTLLARELRAARAAEARDGRQRTFLLDAEQVAAQVPAYGRFVREQVARLGRQHPLVRTQFFSEEIDGQTGMFPAARQALMVGSHPALTRPEPGRLYVMLLDVAGEEESHSGRPYYSDQQMILPFADPQLVDDLTSLAHSRRDSTALTIVEVGLETLADELVRAPTYRVVYRQEWQGERHTHLYAQITALAAGWSVRKLVVDATGVGAGLASFLERALPGRVLPDDLVPKGRSPINQYLPLLLDGDDRLVLALASPRYIARSPAAIATSVGLLVVPGSGYFLAGVDVVNTSALDRTLKLYWHDDLPSDDSTVVIAPGLTVAAKSLFSWRGVLELEARGLYGVASGSGLVLFATLRYGRGSVR